MEVEGAGRGEGEDEDALTLDFDDPAAVLMCIETAANVSKEIVHVTFLCDALIIEARDTSGTCLVQARIAAIEPNEFHQKDLTLAFNVAVLTIILKSEQNATVRFEVVPGANEMQLSFHLTSNAAQQTVFDVKIEEVEREEQPIRYRPVFSVAVPVNTLRNIIKTNRSLGAETLAFRFTVQQDARTKLETTRVLLLMDGKARGNEFWEWVCDPGKGTRVEHNSDMRSAPRSTAAEKGKLERLMDSKMLCHSLLHDEQAHYYMSSLEAVLKSLSGGCVLVERSDGDLGGLLRLRFVVDEETRSYIAVLVAEKIL